jgi:hypothetical protein
MNRCASCGYDRDTHDLGTLRCHPATADKNGRRGTFKVPPPIDRTLWRDIMARDAAAARQAVEDARKPYEPEIVPPPLVPARPPYGPQEYATSNRGMSAAKLGRAAITAGWDVSPWYWQEHDGKEGCALRLARGELRAVALWSRSPSAVGMLSGWKTEYAYAWRADDARVPTKMTITILERLIDDPDQ